MNAKEKWQLVEEKREELRRLTEEAWKNEEWEMAALGERVLKTTDDARTSAQNMKTAMGALNRELEKLKP